MLAFAAYSCHAGWEANMRSQEIAAGSQTWARRVLLINGVVLLTLSCMPGGVMHRPESCSAPLFLIAVILVAVISKMAMVDVFGQAW